MSFSFLTADTLTLQSAREAEEATKENAQAETLATGQTPDEEETYVSYVLNALNRRSILAMLLMASGGIITLGLLYFPTRQVRRLSQVQRMKPDGVMREMIRMETLAHEQWMGLLGRSREVPKDKVSWGLIRGGTSKSTDLFCFRAGAGANLVWRAAIDHFVVFHDRSLEPLPQTQHYTTRWQTILARQAFLQIKL